MVSGVSLTNFETGADQLRSIRTATGQLRSRRIEVGLGDHQLHGHESTLTMVMDLAIKNMTAIRAMKLMIMVMIRPIFVIENFHSSTKKKDQFILKESQIIDILNYFHPSIEVGDEKYVYHVRNLLWDKDVDIENVLAYLEEHDSVRLSELSSIEVESSSLLDNLYEQYCKFYNKKNVDRHSLLVSKSYFIKYISRGRAS